MGFLKRSVVLCVVAPRSQEYAQVFENAFELRSDDPNSSKASSSVQQHELSGTFSMQMKPMRPVTSLCWIQTPQQMVAFPSGEDEGSLGGNMSFPSTPKMSSNSPSQSSPVQQSPVKPEPCLTPPTPKRTPLADQLQTIVPSKLLKVINLCDEFATGSSASPTASPTGLKDLAVDIDTQMKRVITDPTNPVGGYESFSLCVVCDGDLVEMLAEKKRCGEAISFNPEREYDHVLRLDNDSGDELVKATPSLTPAQRLSALLSTLQNVTTEGGGKIAASPSGAPASWRNHIPIENFIAVAASIPSPTRQPSKVGAAVAARARRSSLTTVSSSRDVAGTTPMALTSMNDTNATTTAVGGSKQQHLHANINSRFGPQGDDALSNSMKEVSPLSLPPLVLDATDEEMAPTSPFPTGNLGESATAFDEERKRLILAANEDRARTREAIEAAKQQQEMKQKKQDQQEQRGQHTVEPTKSETKGNQKQVGDSRSEGTDDNKVLMVALSVAAVATALSIGLVIAELRRK